MARATNYFSWIIAALGLTVFATSESVSQEPSVISNTSLNQPHLIQYLEEGRLDAFRTTDVAGIYYPAAVYIRGIGICPNLKTTNISLSNLSVLSDPKEAGRLIALNSEVSEILRDVKRSMRALFFHGSGQADIEQIIRQNSCNGEKTRAVIGSAEAIVVERVEQRKKDTERRHQDNLRAQEFYRKNKLARDKYFREMREGNTRIAAISRGETKACSEKYPTEKVLWDRRKPISETNPPGGYTKPNPKLKECQSAVNKRHSQRRHEMETSLERSMPHVQLTFLATRFGELSAYSDVCGIAHVGTARAEIEKLAGQYYSTTKQSFLDQFDLQYDRSYQHGLQYFRTEDGGKCKEQERRQYDHDVDQELKQRITEWHQKFHGKPDHRPHTS